MPQPTTPAGNAQLDQFVDSPDGLTGQKPPEIEQSVAEIWDNPDFDEEDRVSMMEEYPEISEPMMAEEESDPSNDVSETKSGGMMRLRILRDMPEPILDESGEEIELLEGDSFNCSSLTAQTLIAAGWAEAITLE